MMTDQEINIAIAEVCGWKRAERHDYDAWSDAGDPDAMRQIM